MKIKTLSGREQFIFIICIGVIVVASLVLYILRPALASIESLDQQISALQLKIQKGTIELATRDAVEQQYNNYYDMFRQSGSDTAEATSMLTSIEQAVHKTGVNLGNMQPQKMVKKDLFNIYTVRLTIEGPDAAIYEFLHFIQSPPFGFFVEELQLEQLSRSNQMVKGRVVLNKVRINLSGKD